MDKNKYNLRKDIEYAINCASAEKGSDTPDFILAEYLMDCLEVYDRTIQKRELWHGREILAVEEELPPLIQMQFQVNGKPSGIFNTAPNSSSEDLENMVRDNKSFTRHFEGKEIKKIIVVPNKLVNVVV